MATTPTADSVRVDTFDGKSMKGSPFSVAAWLVENYGGHADAMGFTGNRLLVEETYDNIAKLLGGAK